MKRRDALKPWRVFRDARTGLYVSRTYALLNPATTVSETRGRKRRPSGSDPCD